MQYLSNISKYTIHEKYKLTLTGCKQQDGQVISPSLPVPVCLRGAQICNLNLIWNLKILTATTYLITEKSKFKTFQGNRWHFNAWKIDIYRYIWRLWQGFHRNETNSAQQINYSTCKSQELKFSHPHQLQEQKKLQFCHPFFPYCKKQEQFFSLWWSKASTRRWSLLPLRFVVSPHMYPLEIPEWNQDELRSKNIFFRK